MKCSVKIQAPDYSSFFQELDVSIRIREDNSEVFIFSPSLQYIDKVINCLVSTDWAPLQSVVFKSQEHKDYFDKLLTIKSII